MLDLVCLAGVWVRCGCLYWSCYFPDSLHGNVVQSLIQYGLIRNQVRWKCLRLCKAGQLSVLSTWRGGQDANIIVSY